MILRHGAYYYIVRGKYMPLGREYGPALIRYAELVGSAPRITTVSEAISHYLQAAAKRLAPRTLTNYRISAERLCRTFGNAPLSKLTAAHVYRYLIEYGNTAANRDRALLSAAYSEARRIGAFSGDDPTKALQYRNPEKPRRRYVTDEELERAIAAASPKLGCILRFAYLTGLRQGDVLRIRMDDITDDGIAVTASKTQKAQVIDWTDELRSTVDAARRLWRRFGREYLFESLPKGKHAKRGPGPYTGAGLRALWRAARAKAGLQDVRFHDLRRKAGSDVQDDATAQSLLQHGDIRTTRRHYRAKPVRNKPVR